MSALEVAVRERAASAVHQVYVDRKRNAGVTSAASRNGDGTAELLVPYEELPEADRDDDRASVDAVLVSLRGEDPAVVARLIWSDRVLEDQLREMFAVCDPPPAGLAPRLATAASAEAAARAGLAAAAVTRDTRTGKGTAR